LMAMKPTTTGSVLHNDALILKRLFQFAELTVVPNGLNCDILIAGEKVRDLQISPLQTWRLIYAAFRDIVGQKFDIPVLVDLFPTSQFLLTMPSLLRGFTKLKVKSSSLTLVTITADGKLVWHNGSPDDVTASVALEMEKGAWLFATDPQTYSELEDVVHGILVRADQGANVMSTRTVYYYGAPTLLVSCVAWKNDENRLPEVGDVLPFSRGWKFPKTLFDWTEWSADDLLWLMRYYGNLSNTFGVKTSPEANREFLNLCCCLAPEVQILDTEDNTYTSPTKVSDWTCMSYPPVEGGLMGGLSFVSMKEAIILRENCLYLVKGASRERKIFEAMGVLHELRFVKERGVCGIFDVDWLGYDWPKEPAHHASFNGVLKVLYHVAKIEGHSFARKEPKFVLSDMVAIWDRLLNLEIPFPKLDHAVGMTELIKIREVQSSFPCSPRPAAKPKFYSGKLLVLPQKTCFPKYCYAPFVGFEPVQKDSQYDRIGKKGWWFAPSGMAFQEHDGLLMTDGGLNYIPFTPGVPYPYIVGYTSVPDVYVFMEIVMEDEDAMPDDEDRGGRITFLGGMASMPAVIGSFIASLTDDRPVHPVFKFLGVQVRPKYSPGPAEGDGEHDWFEFRLGGLIFDVEANHFGSFIQHLLKWDMPSFSFHVDDVFVQTFQAQVGPTRQRIEYACNVTVGASVALKKIREMGILRQVLDGSSAHAVKVGTFHT